MKSGRRCVVSSLPPSLHMQSWAWAQCRNSAFAERSAVSFLDRIRMESLMLWVFFLSFLLYFTLRFFWLPGDCGNDGTLSFHAVSKREAQHICCCLLTLKNVSSVPLCSILGIGLLWGGGRLAFVAVQSGCRGLGIDLSYFDMLMKFKKMKNVNPLSSCFVSLTLNQGHDLM